MLFVGHGCAGRTAPVPAVTAELARCGWTSIKRDLGSRPLTFKAVAARRWGLRASYKAAGSARSRRALARRRAGCSKAESSPPTGNVRIANACTNPDLFWRYKGVRLAVVGAVITKLTLRSSTALPEFFGAAWGKIKAGSDAASPRLIAHFIDSTRTSCSIRIGGEQGFLRPDKTLHISMVCQGLDAPQASKSGSRSSIGWPPQPQDLAVVDKLGAGAVQARIGGTLRETTR